MLNSRLSLLRCFAFAFRLPAFRALTLHLLALPHATTLSRILLIHFILFPDNFQEL